MQRSPSIPVPHNQTLVRKCLSRPPGGNLSASKEHLWNCCAVPVLSLSIPKCRKASIGKSLDLQAAAFPLHEIIPLAFNSNSQKISIGSPLDLQAEARRFQNCISSIAAQSFFFRFEFKFTKPKDIDRFLSLPPG